MFETTQDENKGIPGWDAVLKCTCEYLEVEPGKYWTDGTNVK